MKITNRFSSYGLEDLDESALPTPDEAIPDDVVEDEVESTGASADAVMTDVDTMSDVGEALESIALGIRSTLKRGGLTRQGAAFALQSADLQLARLGLEGIQVSVEDFAEGEVTPEAGVSAEPGTSTLGGDPVNGLGGEENDAVPAGGTDNVVATEGTWDDVKAKAKKIWEAIKAAVINFAKIVRDFFTKLLDFSGRLEKAAEKMKKKFEDVKNDTTKEANIKVGGVGKSLAQGGGLAKPPAVAKLAEILKAGATSEMAAKVKDVSGKVKTAAAATSDKAKIDEVNIAIDEMVTSYKSNFESINGAGTKETKDGKEITKSSDMIGNVCLVITKPTDKTDGAGASYALEAITGKQSPPETIPAPSKADCIAYCEAVIANAKAVGDVRKFMGEMDRHVDAMVVAIDKAVVAGTDKNEKYSATISANSKAFRNVSKGVYQVNKIQAGHAMKVSKAALQLCNITYKNYKTPEGEAK